MIRPAWSQSKSRTFAICVPWLPSLRTELRKDQTIFCFFDIQFHQWVSFFITIAIHGKGSSKGVNRPANRSCYTKMEMDKILFIKSLVPRERITPLPYVFFPVANLLTVIFWNVSWPIIHFLTCCSRYLPRRKKMGKNLGQAGSRIQKRMELNELV